MGTEKGVKLDNEKPRMDEVLEEHTSDNFADYIIDYFLDKKQTDKLENLEL